MRKFNVVFLLMIIATLFACTKKIDVVAKDPIWGRDVCTRCVMAVDDKHFAAQIVNSQDGKRYYFDDFGCAVLWIEENNTPWKNVAVVYVTDGVTGKWVSVAEAVFALGYKTPMSFGVAAFKDKASIEAGKTVITYEQAVQNFKDIVSERKMKKAAQKNQEEGGMGHMK